MLDYLDDIESDLSRFHGVKKPHKLASSQYFKLAERLPYYEGVVRAKLIAELNAEQQSAAQPESSNEVMVSLATILGDRGDGLTSMASGIQFKGG